MITVKPTTGEIFQGNLPIADLSPLEKASLLYFNANPRLFLTKSQIIKNSWPEDVHRDGVTDESLYRVICSIRRKLRREPFERIEYIKNWRGIRGREGGYRFFPNGQIDSLPVSKSTPPSSIVLEEIVEQKEILILLINKTERIIQNLKDVYD